MTLLLKNGTLVNEGEVFKGSILVEGNYIKQIIRDDEPIPLPEAKEVIDLEGKYVFPGIIDDQVHFREPGLTHKADIRTESRAAVAGGITSFMEMPNTVPNALTVDLLEDKYEIAAESSIANYSFYMGASNDNIEEVLKVDGKKVCGLKVFMGSSTGNMLVDNETTLRKIFSECDMLIASHCEDEDTIRANTAKFKAQYGAGIPFKYHPQIRSEEACYRSSSFAAGLANEYGAHLHILHLSTERELSLFDQNKPLKDKNLTAEACVHHMWFSDSDYDTYGSRIKWNPAVKKASDRDAILRAVINNRIDVVATDHAPHTAKEKSLDYWRAPSGGPLVQHALVSMLEHVAHGRITIEKVIEKMCHAPADLFNVDKRGFLKEGYFADITVVDLNSKWEVSSGNILYKCGWSPFEGQSFSSKVLGTWVNGKLVYDNLNGNEVGEIIEANNAMRLTFGNN
ncbi:MAG: dihydroorotase [Crocinitomicaceae bacterium]|nr:dihydroorotase [Crocinitomicaceae bacterium]|tara:strand:- start:13015 stop:14379 length:1365 start_codon:yes stop_codon:yes gene_type:complete